MKSTRASLSIGVLPGDGIGQEVMAVTLPVLDALGIHCELHHGAIGWECWRTGGDPVPGPTWELIKSCDAVLLGAITSKPPREAEAELAPTLKGCGLRYVSPVVQLRQRLGLFANVRPIESVLPTARPFRCAVVRENTEGLYAGLDFAPLPPELRRVIASERGPHQSWTIADLGDASAAIRLQTGAGLRRLLRFAFAAAVDGKYGRLTFADKPNVLRLSGNFARSLLEEIAGDFPDVPWDIQNVDALAMSLVKNPDRYGIVVAENMFGDILSDVAAAAMGGLGLAPSGNFGAGGAYFEPVHGSAPRHAGKRRANPSAMFLTVAMMLDHHGFVGAAAAIRQALTRVVRRGEGLTYDLGGDASTDDMARRIIDECVAPRALHRVAFLSIGDELIRGDVVGSNSVDMARELQAQGVAIGAHVTVGDNVRDIKTSLLDLAARHEAVIVTGGLGPTSDDRTRDAVAAASGQPLVHDEASWDHIQARLGALKIDIHPDNRRQAGKPASANILANGRGTAPGLNLNIAGAQVFVLPGPPSEALPMFHAGVMPGLAAGGFFAPVSRERLRLIGLMEADVAAELDVLRISALGGRTADALAPIAYRYNYPFIDVTISGSDLKAVQALADKARASLGGASLKDAGRRATEALQAQLVEYGLVADVVEDATGGELRAALVTTRCASSGQSFLRLSLTGLAELQSGTAFGGQTEVALNVELGCAAAAFVHQIPMRGPEVRVFASEWAAHQTLKALGQFMATNAEDPA